MPEVTESSPERSLERVGSRPVDTDLSRGYANYYRPDHLFLGAETASAVHDAEGTAIFPSFCLLGCASDLM